MLFVSLDQAYKFFADDDGNGKCSVQLLAKDGIYLSKMPRSIDAVHLASGNRADLAVSCQCETYPCVVTVKAEEEGTNNGVIGMKEAFSLKIKETLGVSSTPILPETSVRRPCYVADMSRAVPDRFHQMEFQHLAGDRHVIYWDGHDHEMTVQSTQEHKAAGSSHHPFIDHWEVGTLHEIHANGQMKHPGHFHVNPFQIASVLQENNSETNLKADNYFQAGDFHDTIFIPTMKLGYESLVLRMQADRHVGKMALHCHFLAHEDDGMMAYIDIQGKQGTVCKQAKELQPSCYEDAFEPMTK